MKEAIINISRVLGSIFLIVLALVLFLVTTPLAFIWKAVVSVSKEKRKARDILTGSATFFVNIAASYDQLGNAVFGGFFNWLFLKEVEMRYSFGDKDDTISEVLGWNVRIGSLNNTGRYLVRFLDAVDKEHCEKALQNGIFKARTKLYSFDNLHIIL